LLDAPFSHNTFRRDRQTTTDATLERNRDQLTAIALIDHYRPTVAKEMIK